MGFLTKWVKKSRTGYGPLFIPNEAPHNGWSVGNPRYYRTAKEKNILSQFIKGKRKKAKTSKLQFRLVSESLKWHDPIWLKHKAPQFKTRSGVVYQGSYEENYDDFLHKRYGSSFLEYKRGTQNNLFYEYNLTNVYKYDYTKHEIPLEVDKEYLEHFRKIKSTIVPKASSSKAHIMYDPNAVGSMIPAIPKLRLVKIGEGSYSENLFEANDKEQILDVIRLLGYWFNDGKLLKPKINETPLDNEDDGHNTDTVDEYAITEATKEYISFVEWSEVFWDKITKVLDFYNSYEFNKLLQASYKPKKKGSARKDIIEKENKLFGLVIDNEEIEIPYPPIGFFKIYPTTSVAGVFEYAKEVLKEVGANKFFNVLSAIDELKGNKVALFCAYTDVMVEPDIIYGELPMADTVFNDPRYAEVFSKIRPVSEAPEVHYYEKEKEIVNKENRLKQKYSKNIKYEEHIKKLLQIEPPRPEDNNGEPVNFLKFTNRIVWQRTMPPIPNTYSKPLSFKFAAVYPLLGTHGKWWDRVFQDNGYRQDTRRKRRSKKEKRNNPSNADRSPWATFQKEPFNAPNTRNRRYTHAYMLMCMDLTPFFQASTRKSANWKMYLKAILNFCEKMTPFKMNQTSSAEMNVGLEIGYTSRMRVKGYKKIYPKSYIDKMGKCFMERGIDGDTYLVLAKTNPDDENTYIGRCLSMDRWFNKRVSQGAKAPNFAGLEQKPLMPEPVWRKMSPMARSAVFDTTIYYLWRIEWEEKKAKWIAKVLGIIKIIIGVILVYFSYGALAQLGYALIISGIADIVMQLGMVGLGRIIQVAATIYSIYTGFAGAGGSSATALSVASAVLSTVSLVIDISSALQGRKNSEDLENENKKTKALSKEAEEEAEKLKQLEGTLDLSGFNCKVSYDAEMEAFYEKSYGNMAYSVYDEYAYDMSARVYDQNFDRFD